MNATGAGGIANVAGGPDSTASLVISGSQLVGNLTRHGDGGAIYNVSQGGATLLSISTTSVSSNTGYLNPNQAALGAGIYQDRRRHHRPQQGFLEWRRDLQPLQRHHHPSPRLARPSQQSEQPRQHLLPRLARGRLRQRV